MNYSLKTMLILVLCLTSGCASLLPYKDTYDCPQMEQGKCVSVGAAHEYALNAQTGNFEEKNDAVMDPALVKAIENYRKAVVNAKPKEVEERQKDLLRIINPGHAEEFTEALIEYRDSVKSGDTKHIWATEKRLHAIHTLALAGAKASVRLEYSMSREATRQEYLGKYAQGQHAPAVMMPPTIMETYILPYQTAFGTLAGERTLWIMVEEPQWTWPDSQSDKQGAGIGSFQRGR